MLQINFENLIAEKPELAPFWCSLKQYLTEEDDKEIIDIQLLKERFSSIPSEMVIDALLYLFIEKRNIKPAYAYLHNGRIIGEAQEYPTNRSIREIFPENTEYSTCSDDELDEILNHIQDEDDFVRDRYGNLVSKDDCDVIPIMIPYPKAG